jgi:hypothetical protein
METLHLIRYHLWAPSDFLLLALTHTQVFPNFLKYIFENLYVLFPSLPILNTVVYPHSCFLICPFLTKSCLQPSTFYEPGPAHYWPQIGKWDFFLDLILLNLHAALDTTNQCHLLQTLFQLGILRSILPSFSYCLLFCKPFWFLVDFWPPLNIWMLFKVLGLSLPYINTVPK